MNELLISWDRGTFFLTYIYIYSPSWQFIHPSLTCMGMSLRLRTRASLDSLFPCIVREKGKESMNEKLTECWGRDYVWVETFDLIFLSFISFIFLSFVRTYTALTVEKPKIMGWRTQRKLDRYQLPPKREIEGCNIKQPSIRSLKIIIRIY